MVRGTDDEYFNGPFADDVTISGGILDWIGNCGPIQSHGIDACRMWVGLVVSEPDERPKDSGTSVRHHLGFQRIMQ
jgi:hypothetical protein